MYYTNTLMLNTKTGMCYTYIAMHYTNSSMRNA